MSDNRTTELLQELRDLTADVNPNEIIDHVSITRMGWTFDAQWLSSWHAEFDRITDKLEQAIAATLGEKPRDRTEEWLLKACNRATQDYVTQLEQEVDELKGKLEAATLKSELNPDGLPMGLTISDDGNLLNWRGENYVKQSTLVGGTLTAEQVREVMEKHWHDLPDEYDMPEATALPEYSYNWQVIADELNALLGSGTCEVSYEQEGIPRCSECQNVLYDEYKDSIKNYCDECGRKVVER